MGQHQASKLDPPKEAGSCGSGPELPEGTCVLDGFGAPLTFGRARRTAEQQDESTEPKQGRAGGKTAPNRGGSKETNQEALEAGLTAPRLPPGGTGHPGAVSSASGTLRAQPSISSSLSWVAPTCSG